MRRTGSLFLTALFLLSACAPAQPQAAARTAPSADTVALAVLAACGMDQDQLRPLDTQLDSEGLSAYLTGFYDLPEGS